MTENPSEPYAAPHEGQLAAAPAPQQPQYPQAPWGYAPRPRTNGLAIASMTLGILWLYWLGSVVALVLGYVALRQIKNAPAHEPQEGRGMAIAGIVLGWVGMAVLVLVVAVGVFFAVSPDA